MRYLIHLFQLLHNHGVSTIRPVGKPVLVFNPTEFRLISAYYPHVIQRKIESVSWSDLFKRSFVFSKPPMIKGNTLSAILKILCIRCFYENSYELCRRFATTDAILGKANPRDFYVDGPHLMELFQTHFPSFTIRVALTRHRILRDLFIRFVATVFRNFLIDLNPGISIFSNFDNEVLLRTFRDLHPHRKVIIRFCDTIAPRKIPEIKSLLTRLLNSGIINKAESYFEDNANVLNIPYRPNSVCLKSLKPFRFNCCHYLYAFIGVSDSSQTRLTELNTIKSHIFALYPSIRPYIKELVAQRVAHFVPYKDYLAILGSSEVVIDMYRRFPREGFSFRTAEALVLNKKVITNRTNIRDSWFYHPNRFFIIGYDVPARLQSFLESDFPPLTEQQLKSFTTDHITY